LHARPHRHRHPAAAIVTTIIAAIVVGILLLWGGIAGLLRLVELFERKHVLALGAYTTLVSGLVMGLVLFNAQERQKEHQRDLREQMTAVTRRLSDLSERLVGQLAEKADLTVSEFEIRARLQTERSDHENTRQELSDQQLQFDELQATLNRERRSRLAYQDEVNRKLEERFAEQDDRHRSIRDFLDVHQRLVQGIQKQLAGVQDDVTRANTKVAEIAAGQTNLLGRVTATREIGDLSSKKIEALARNQAALYDDLVRTMAQIDSLYSWKKK
jgi:chromosome segregation ATPase